MAAAIPCLIIQPLVENAVIHGIGKHSKGKILVKVSKKSQMGIEAECVTFLVADNGCGMAKSKLDALNKRLAEKEEDFDIGKHSGLINVQRRLCLLYGDGYGLTIKSKEEAYFCVTGEIPFRVWEGVDEDVSGPFD